MDEDYDKFYRFENYPKGLVWRRVFNNWPEAYCEKHRIPLTPGLYVGDLKCLVDDESFKLNNSYAAHKQAAEGLLHAIETKKYEVVRIDPEGTSVLAQERFDNLIEGYFITAKASDSSKGIEIMIQVGKREPGAKKVQLFVEPPRERLSFDHSGKDKHPTGIFTEVRAIFRDSVSIIAESDKKPDEDLGSRPTPKK